MIKKLTAKQLLQQELEARQEFLKMTESPTDSWVDYNKKLPQVNAAVGIGYLIERR